MSPRSPVLIQAPSNLGLRPQRTGHEPGTWRAPQALAEAGLIDAITPSRVVDLPRPIYSSRAQSGTRLLNGYTIRAFNLGLAVSVAAAMRAVEFPIVIGGDCSILLGALAGARTVTPVALVHIDGHSDFRHPGNYDPAEILGAVAGMDLALATGRGEALLAEWPGVSPPLVPDEHVIQIGEREGRDPDFAWPDVAATAIAQIDVFSANQMGVAALLARTSGMLDRVALPHWVHLDIDVLDQTVMPAVDSPGSPGIAPDDLTVLLGGLLRSPRCIGLDVTVFDPDLDADGACARTIVSIIRDALGTRFSHHVGD